MGRNPEPNVNVKESLSETNVNVKGIGYGKLKSSISSQAKIRRTQSIADQLVRKFGAHSKSSYRYFCKCAYRLPQNIIWDCYESAQAPKVTNKLAYFIAATKAYPEMQ